MPHRTRRRWPRCVATAGPADRATRLPALFDAVLEGEVRVRSRRALRGRDIAAEHPRVFIWGLLEARGCKPSMAWQGAGRTGGGRLAPGDRSRPLDEPADARSAPACYKPGGTGRPGPRTIFVSAACAARRWPCCPVRAAAHGCACAVPARWLARTGRASWPATGQALTGATRLPPSAGAAAGPVRSPAAPRPVAAPRRSPAQPSHLRPRRLRVTEVQTWPLKTRTPSTPATCCELRPLDPLEQGDRRRRLWLAGACRGLQSFPAAEFGSNAGRPTPPSHACAPP